jgi:hypothetical protein
MNTTIQIEKYILNEQDKYFYEKIVDEQYENIYIKNKDNITISINILDLYYKIFYNNEKFNIYNFMLFKNLYDDTKDKINIIHTIISIIELKYLKNLNYLELFFKINNINFDNLISLKLFSLNSRLNNLNHSIIELYYDKNINVSLFNQLFIKYKENIDNIL